MNDPSLMLKEKGRSLLLKYKVGANRFVSKLVSTTGDSKSLVNQKNNKSIDFIDLVNGNKEVYLIPIH